MRRIVSKTGSHWLRSESGATAIIFALSLLPILLLAGYAVDIRRATIAKSALQNALDAAVLAGALEYSRGAFLDPGQREANTGDVVDDIFGIDISGNGGVLSSQSVSFAIDGDGVRGTASGNVPLIFGGLFGHSSIDVSVESVAEAAPARNLEIILALDNTTSMFRQSRFDQMRGAAKGFVNDLFDNPENQRLTSVGVVPWATLVNINSERPRAFNASAAADRAVGADGRRVVPNAPFENRLRYLLEPEDDRPYTRDQMERDFAPVTWRGCVRAAPGERRVSGGGAVTQPLTDDPVPGMRWHASFVEPELETVQAPEGFNEDDEDDDDDISLASLSVPTGEVLRCTQRPERGGGNIHLNITQPCSTGDNRPVDRIADACVSDPNEFDYFRTGGRACPWQNNIFPWTRQRSISGPNQNCPVAMLGLSRDRGQIIDKLDEMHPATGGTHMDLGLMWGLRALSPQPTWANFFGQPTPAAYDDEQTRKVLILLSDGENIAPGAIEGYYGCTEGDTRGAAGECWQADGVNRLSGGALNALTADACTAIRGYGIELYTIAVDVDNNTALDLLAECAADGDRAFNIRASQIDEVFQAIAARELRLTE
ncbi:MAG: pilus assembly protein TadG-related protein [Pseudomonadota bacterium]